MPHRPRTAFTLIEMLVVVSIIGLLVGILLPAIGKARDTAQVTASITNLRNLGTAHAAYASGHNDRSLTFWVDAITSYGNSTSAYIAYAQEVGNTHPNVVLGYGPYEYGNPNVVLHQYLLDGSSNGHHGWAGVPIAWSLSFGVFRFGHQTRSFSPLLSGRYYDATFWAPKDRMVLDIVEPGFDSPNEFAMIPDDNGLWGGELWYSSYCLSPAAMWSPEVMAHRSETGATYTNPWSFPAGLRVPSMSHALHPNLKSHMLEHSWLQNKPLDCNPAFTAPAGCEPWYFNAGLSSVPMTLFYDGHVEGLGVREAQLADARHMAQTGYGLWSRDTPLGTNGYFSWVGYDVDANTSFHILTTDGIRGRDTMAR